MKSSSGRILVGGDEQEFRISLEPALRGQGYSVLLAADGDEVLSFLEQQRTAISAVLLDMIMPNGDGMDALRAIRRTEPDLPVIMLSGASTAGNIVEVMKSGATDFLEKPVKEEHLASAIGRALRNRAASVTPIDKRPVANRAEARDWLGNSPAMREIERTVAQVGSSDAPVLIQGETGVGKEVVARRLHALSARADKPLLKLNCAALPSELVESELFGYEKGAFTGAFQRKQGIFELADGGTIFLDEIGDMDLKLQAKLLQVLQDHEFMRLGGREMIRVDVRVIAATHNDLETASSNRTFRADLYYRLNVITLHIPPLRERANDILPLCEILLEKHTAPGSARPRVTPALEQALLMHEWPGNVRELENVMRRLLVLRSPDLIVSELRAKASRKLNETPQMLSAGLPGSTPIRHTILDQVSKARDEAESEAILAALKSTNWNRKRAASLLKIDYKALLYKMKKLSIDDKFVTMPKVS